MSALRAVSHVELTTWIGGPGLFLHFFHAMHAQTRTAFCDPNRLFLGPYGKSRGFEPLTFEKTSPSLIDGAVFSAASFAEVTFGGVLGPKAQEYRDGALR